MTYEDRRDTRGHKDQVLKDRQRGQMRGKGTRSYAGLVSQNSGICLGIKSELVILTGLTQTHTQHNTLIIQLWVCFCLGDTALCSHLLSD